MSAVVSLLPVAGALSQGAPQTPQQKAQQAVKTRQAVFDLVVFSWGPSAASLRPGGLPLSPATAAKLAQRLQLLATYIPEVFGAADTHGVAGLTTRARDCIWVNKSGFDQKTADFGVAAATLEATAKGGDANEIRKAILGVAKGCSGCHDEFRDN
jgi:cytochrome c556